MIAPVPTPERADACLAALDDPGQVIARRVVLRLVRFRDGGAEAGRPQPRSTLASPRDAGRLADIVQHLADGGVVRLAGDAGPDAVALAVVLLDDALAAPTLQRWIASHGHVEQLRRQLEADAAAWQQRAADAAMLDRPQLVELAAWLNPEAHRDLGISELADSFIAASRARRRHWWPGKTSIGGALAILMILVILATPITLASLIALTAAMIHKFL
ncbi:MAG TPA: hypothetical protein VHW23_44420 [Kofleriaceae bacterium]|nr:hypothetical protein [Kofleriaceae bacterium]